MVYVVVICIFLMVVTTDQEKPEARSALRDMGKEVVMLTNDRGRTALAVTRKVSIEANHVVARVLPSEKGRHGELTAGRVGAGTQ